MKNSFLNQISLQIFVINNKKNKMPVILCVIASQIHLYATQIRDTRGEGVGKGQKKCHVLFYYLYDS